VAAGEPLYRVYAEFPADLAFAQQSAVRASGYSVGDAGALPHVFVEF